MNNSMRIGFIGLGNVGGALAGIETATASAAYTLRLDLRSATTYSVQVAARNLGGLSAYSATATAVTDDFDIDVDSSGGVDWEDGMMIARYLAGVRGDGLVAGITSEPFAADVGASIQSELAMFDVDGADGVTAADGIMIARHFLGVRGPALTAGMSSANPDDVAAKINQLPQGP